MKQLFFVFSALFLLHSAFADKYQDSFVEAAYTGNIMLVKTHINDLRGKTKERHNEALRASVMAAASTPEAAPEDKPASKTAKIAARFKGSSTDVIKMLLASGANPNDQSFGRATIFSTATNDEVKALLEEAQGKNSLSDLLASDVKLQNTSEFSKHLEAAQPGELKLGNGLHIPTVIFDNYPVKKEAQLVGYNQNTNAFVKMYASLANSKKASDIFVVYTKDQDQFGRFQKTEPLVGKFLAEERWDLLEILVDHNEVIPAPSDKIWSEKWFHYRKNLMLSLIQNSTEIKDENFVRMNQFLDGSRIKKFDDFAKKLPPIETEQLDQFFLQSDIPVEQKLKLFEELGLKISAPTMASYISKKEVALQEQEFRILEKLTIKGKPIPGEIVIPVFEAGNVKTAQQFLRLGASANSMHNGEIGLCIAVKKNNFQLAQLLISYKADLGITCIAADGKPVTLDKMEMSPQLKRLLFAQ